MSDEETGRSEQDETDMTGYLIKCNGERVGYTTDRELAAFIDGLELGNGAWDLEDQERYEYSVD